MLYLAGKNYTDFWAIATSRDEGATIQPISSYSDVKGMKPCVMAICGDACSLAASQGVWMNAVCTNVVTMPPPPPPGSSGCHCTVAGAAPRGTAALGALLAITVAIHRRRRRR